MGLELLQAFVDLVVAALRVLPGELARVLGGLCLLDHQPDLVEIVLVPVVLLLVLLGLLFGLRGELLRLLGQLAHLRLDGAERARERPVALPHQLPQLLDQLLERAPHRLGKLLVGFLRLVVAGLGVLLGRVEALLGLLAIFLRVLEVALLDLLQRVLALGDRGLALVPRLLSVLLAFLGGLVELLQLFEFLLVLVVFGLCVFVNLLGLFVILLRLLRELPHLGEDGIDGLLQGRLALRQHLLEPLDSRRQRHLHLRRQLVRDLLELVDAELRLGLALLELRLERIDVLLRLVPLLVLALLDGVLAAVEHRLARLVRLLAVVLDVEAGLDPVVAVLVDRLIDLQLVLLEFLLIPIDVAVDLVDQCPGLVDVSPQPVADLLLDGLLRVLDRLLGLGHRFLRLGDGLLRLIERVLRAGGHGSEDGLIRGLARLLDRIGHLRQVAADGLEERLRHRVGLGGAHLDGALALGDADVGESHPRLADGQGRLRRGEQALLDPLHGRGERRLLVARRVHRVERRRLHRIECVLRMLAGVLRQLDDVSRRLMRRLQRLLPRFVRRRRNLAGGLAHLARGLAQVALDPGHLLLGPLQHRLGQIAVALLHLLERLLHLVVEGFGRVARLLRPLRRLARGLQRERRRLLDLLGDLLGLLGGFLGRFGELGEILDRRTLLLDRVPLGAKLGGVAGVGEEDVLAAGDVVLPVDALARLVHLDDGARLHRGVAGDPAFRRDEDASASVELGLRDRLEQVLLPAGDGHDRFHLAEHLLDQLRPGDLAALGAVLVALLGRRGHVLHLGRVPAAGADPRDLVVGVHLHGEAADVLAPDELRGRRLPDLRLLEAELLSVDVEAEPGQRRTLHEEVVVGEVRLDHVVVDDLAVVHVGGETVALGELARQVRVLHVLVRPGLRALGETLALVEAGHQ